MICAVERPNVALNGFCKASLVAAPTKDLEMDIERVRAGRTADNDLQESDLSLLHVITLAPRRFPLPPKKGVILLESLNLPMHDLSLAI